MSRIPAYALAKEINGKSYVEESSVIEMAREYCSEIDKLEEENESLKKRIKDLEDVCDGSCFSGYEEFPYGNEPEEKDALIAKLQDQHQQDCIRYNDMRTAYLITLDELAKLREQFRV